MLPTVTPSERASEKTKYAAFATITSLGCLAALCAVEAVTAPQLFAREVQDPSRGIFGAVVYFWVIGSAFYRHRPLGDEDARISRFFSAIANFGAVLLVLALEYGVYSTTHNRVFEAASAAVAALLAIVIERTLGKLLVPPRRGDVRELRTSLWLLAAWIPVLSAFAYYGMGRWSRTAGSGAHDNANYLFAVWADGVWWVGARLIVIYGRMKVANAAEE